MADLILAAIVLVFLSCSAFIAVTLVIPAARIHNKRERLRLDSERDKSIDETIKRLGGK